MSTPSFSPYPTIPSRTRSAVFRFLGSQNDLQFKALEAIFVFCGLRFTPEVTDAEVSVVEAHNTTTSFIAIIKDFLPTRLGPAHASLLVPFGHWANLFATPARPVSEELVSGINKDLAKSSYAVLGHFSLVDVALFGVLQPYMASKPADALLHHIDALRYFAHISHLFHAAVQPAHPDFPVVHISLDAPPQELSTGPAETDGASKDQKKEAKKQEKDAKKAAKAERAAQRDEGKKEAAPKEPAEPKPAPPAAAAAPAAPHKEPAPVQDESALLGQLVIKVGLIQRAGPHPSASHSKLFVEDIDVGEGKARVICSGLREYIPEAELQNRKCLVLCNLKPRNFGDIPSNGMVLCASSPDHTKVELLDPPADAAIGERIVFDGITNGEEAVLNPKKKVWEKILPGLHTTADGQAAYLGLLFQTSKGSVRAATLTNSPIG